MAVSRKEKGKGKRDDSDEGRKVAPDKGKKVVLDKGKNIVRDDDEEEEYENEEYVVDEAEEDEARYSSGEEIKVTRKKRHKRIKERFELDEDDYDLLEDANVTGFHRPANLGGKFKRLRKAGYVPGRKDSANVSEEISEEEETEEDEEEMVDDVSEEEVDEYESLSKSQKKGGRQAQRASIRSRRGVQKMKRSSKPSPGERRRLEREALAALNEERVDSDDNDGNDQETLSRRLLEKQFEPSLLEVNYITARDYRLRRTDIPERVQILEETADVLPSSDLELRRAAEWIFDRAFGHLCVPSRLEFPHLLSLEKPEVVRQIANVLHLVHNEKLEVPFIGLYRREECLDLLKEPTDEFSSFEDGPTIQQYKALWAVQEWNKKWLLLQRRKSDLQVRFKGRIPVDVSSIPEKDKIVKNIFSFLEDAESEQATDDCEAQFNLHFPVDESEVVDCGFKRPRFRSLYSISHQAGLGTITKHFGLTSETFGDNVKAGYKRNEVSDEAFLPDDLATKFSTANRSRDPASLIRGARHMLAMEISTEPLVREYVRTFYSKNAVVTTRPTPVGIDAIDAFHQFESVKWINDKLISAFDDEQWLLIQKAEEEKLIDVTVGLSKDSIDNILFECEQLFSSDGLSRTSQSWNEQRKQILQEAIVTLLLPIMENEARMSLVIRAKQVLVAKCGLQLWNKVSVAPYDPAKAANLDCRNEDGPALRVLACCWGPPNVGTTFVMLDADGEILKVLNTGYLNIKAFSPEQAQRKENDQARLMQVIIDHKPHIIVLGAARVQCRYLSQDISDVLFKVVEQHAGDSAEGLDTIKLVYGDESIPSLFETSRISLKHLPGQLGTVRRAVALGRFLQNPVAMVASLCGPSMEVLSIKFHPLQRFLSKEELYDVIERVMVTVVNQVGIDINLAAMHDWLFETLQFVAGLGPRKAEVIRRALQMAGRVLTRNDLYSTVRAMEEKVFTNSAGFIRVRGIGQTSSDLHHQKPLDNTRIHPDWYQMAKDLAEAAIKEARRNNEEVDDDVQEMAVEHVIKNPNVLDTVDIEEYARSGQVEGQRKSIKTLNLIKSELQRGFREWRKPYSEPSKEECFYLLTGESEETLFPGRIVQATVRKVQEHRIMCVLECGLLGFIQKEDLSDCDIEPKDKFTEGSSVICRVKEVKMDKYLVDLTCKESDLRGDSWGDLQPHDKHFRPDTTFLLNEQEKARKKKEDNNKKTFKPRSIIHPKFQNLSTDDAIKALAEKEMGDFIIHPSCKGPAHLSITLKFPDGLFSHIDIAESGKENWDLASFLRLGKTLSIGDGSYKDLDEVISKHVNQLVTHLHAMLQYRKYKEGIKSEIADTLRSEKTEKPKCIPYCISIAHEYPGAFMLSYIRVTNPYHEYISLVPSGFRFRKKVFDTIDKLVVYFQSHFHDPIPEASNRTTNWGERGRGRGGRGRGDRGRGRGRGDRGRGRGDRGRGWGGRGRGRGESSWDKGGGRFGNDNERGGWDDNPSSKERAWANDTSTTNSNGRGHDWDSGTGNGNWGDDRGTTSDTKGGDSWNDAADGGGWGDKGGIASNAEGEADGWKDATNAAGGGGGGWDNWNDSADGEGGAATNAASGGRGSAWGDKSGIASNIEGEDNAWKGATNAGNGGGSWDNDKAKGENAPKIAGGDSACDGGTKSIDRGDDGWGSVPASGGGWDAVEGGHDDVSGHQSGGSEKGRWNENTGGGGEKTKRWGSDLSPPSPAKRLAHSSWGNMESTPAVDGVGDCQDGGKPANNSATTSDAWGSVANSAGGGGDGWDTAPESQSGGWDAVKSGDKTLDPVASWVQSGSTSHDGGAGENWNQTGRDGHSNRRGRDQDVAQRQERSSGWGSDLPAAPLDIPVQGSWGDRSEPPASTDDGWGQSAERGPDATIVSGGDSGWGALESKETESAGPDWGAVDAVADTWGSGGSGDTTRGWGQQDAASGNDDGWNRQPSQRDYGHWGNRGGRGSQDDGGRWADPGGRGSRNDGGRWEGRGGRGSQNDGGRWEGRRGRGSRNDGGRWEDRGGRGSRNDGGQWGNRGGHGSQNDGGHSSSGWD